MVYRVTCSDEGYIALDYGSLNLSDQYVFDGKSLKNIWKEKSVNLVRDEVGREVGDFLYCAPNFLVCNERVRCLLDGYGIGEFLPIQIKELNERWFILNPLDVIDCLDEKRSKIRYFRSGRVMGIEEYVFDKNKIKEALVFRIPQLVKSGVFATEAFKSLLESHSISNTGLIQL